MMSFFDEMADRLIDQSGLTLTEAERAELHRRCVERARQAYEGTYRAIMMRAFGGDRS